MRLATRIVSLKKIFPRETKNNSLLTCTSNAYTNLTYEEHGRRLYPSFSGEVVSMKCLKRQTENSDTATFRRVSGLPLDAKLTCRQCGHTLIEQAPQQTLSKSVLADQYTNLFTPPHLFRLWPVSRQKIHRRRGKEDSLSRPRFDVGRRYRSCSKIYHGG